MSFLLALLLAVHASIHIGYICGPAWPFAADDPWVVSLLGASPDVTRSVGIALVVVSFTAYLLAAAAGVGIGRSLWRPLVVAASVASGAVLVLFVTPWTLPGIAIDLVLVWATLVAGWRPTPFFGRARQAAPNAPRPSADGRRDGGPAAPVRGYGG